MTDIREVDDAIRTIDALLDEMSREREVGNSSWPALEILAQAESSCFALRESETVTDETRLAELEFAEQFCAAAYTLMDNQIADLTRLRQWLVDGSLEMDRRRIAS